MGAIGARTRLSSYLLVRIAFGNTGAGLVNLAFAMSLIGWFGVNIDLFSSAVSRLALDVFALTIPDWPIEIAAGICMLSTTIFGFKAINFLATLMVPVLAIVTGLLYYSASGELSFSQYLLLEKPTSLTLSEGVGAIVGAIIIGAIILPDITRFSKTWTGGIHTAFWSYMVVELIVMFVAGFAAAAMGKAEILDLMLVLNLGIGAFIIVIAGSWILNSLNLYSTMLSLEATWPKFKGKLFTTVIGAAGVVAAFMNILDIFISFLVFLAAIFVPVAGIIIVDYIFIKPKAYVIETLSDNSRFSWPAGLAWLIGASISAFHDSLWLPSLTGITVLDAVMVSALIYFALAKFLNSRNKVTHVIKTQD
jgi:cytosine permease